MLKHISMFDINMMHVSIVLLTIYGGLIILIWVFVKTRPADLAIQSQVDKLCIGLLYG